MNVTLLAGLLLGANLALTAAVLWLCYLSNRALFDTSKKPSSVNTRRAFFRGFNGLFDLLDRVPLLRRSGTANQFDLLKAVLIVTLPVLLMNLAIDRPGAFVVLATLAVFTTLINVLLLTHPATRRVLVCRRQK